MEPLITLCDGRTIPSLGFGVWQIADEKAEECVHHALSVGYRLIDTAAIYRNEAGVGRAIKRSGLKRDEVFITTKLWNDDQGYERTFAALNQSLTKLSLDYVDLYLIHWPSPQRKLFVESWRALIELKNVGKIRSIGVSNFSAEHLQLIMNETGEIPVVNQIELHPRFQQKQQHQFHTQHNIKTESWSPLGRGRIFNNELLVDIAKKHNRTVAQIIIRWHLQQGFVVIPKSETKARIEENFSVNDFYLDHSDMATISTLDSPFGRVGPHPNQTDF